MKVPAVIESEPAIVAQVVALLAVVLIEAIGWIELGLGEWAPIVAAVLTGAGVTRAKVTPVSKL
jgi:hypothetical protein